MKHLDSVLYALDISSAFPCVANEFDPTFTNIIDAISASFTNTADDAYANATDAAEASTNAVASYIASAAADSADAAASKNVTDAIQAAIDAVVAVDAVAKYYGIDLSIILINDIEFIRKEEYNKMHDDISIYGSIWNNFQTMLRLLDCEFWGILYKNIFENHFVFDSSKIKHRLNVPSEIREQGAKAVASYLEASLSQGSEYLNETRIILLGDKGAGKTSLSVRLHNANSKLPNANESTKSIDISIWDLPNNYNNDAVRVHIWDFAGHVITLSTLRFFLSEQCVYIIVIDGRTEDNNRLEYWLNIAKIYGGNSPVFVFVNMKDNHLPSINEIGLRERYPSINGFYYVSIFDDIPGMHVFLEEIQKFIRSTFTQSKIIPKSWIAVKNELTKIFLEEKIDFLTTERFKSISEKFNIITNEDFMDMRNALHCLGICLSYDNTDEINMHILNPNFLANGIYSIFNWLEFEKEYRIKLSDLKIIFKNELEKFPIEKHQFLLKLLEIYELAYPLPAKKNEIAFLIPTLLTEQEPESNLKNEFSFTDSLCMRFRTESTFPPDTISRFVIRHHQEIVENEKQQMVWRKGVILQSKIGNIASIKEDDREIRIYVKGYLAKYYLNTIKDTLNDIFSTYKNIPSIIEEYCIDNNAFHWFMDRFKIENWRYEGRPISVNNVGSVDFAKIADKYLIDDDVKITNILKNIRADSAPYSPDGRFIVTTSKDGSAQIWNSETCEIIRTLKDDSIHITKAIYSPDVRYIVTASLDNALQIWDIEKSKLMKTLWGHESVVNNMVISPDGKFIASASNDRKVIIWDVDTGNIIKVLKGYNSAINYVTYNSDGKLIITASSDKNINIWDSETGSLLRTLTGHNDAVNSVSYSPDERFIISASSDMTIKIWDSQTGTLVITIEGHMNHVNSAVFSMDGKYIISASSDKTIKIWDSTSYELIYTHTGFTYFIKNAFFSYDCRYIIVLDIAIMIFDSITGNNIAMYNPSINSTDTKALKTYDDLLNIFYQNMRILDFQSASSLLPELEEANKERYENLMVNLAFLFNSDKSLVNNWNSESVKYKATLWSILTDGLTIEKKESEVIIDEPQSISDEGVATTPKNLGAVTTKYKSPQEKGKDLEVSVMKLIKNLFQVVSVESLEIHRQQSGTQFGFDIKFKYIDNLNGECRCKIECKDIGTVKLENITHKIEEARLVGEETHHWILI